ncbi:MAG: tetratricopeptide repeat protein [Kiritimatiellae bacterium]|nr:tetratricopeptide repeat protein [Kiritimatiellia bacterium]MDD4736257.1 tetratricopeptide repeat protein [Kiritimatiellia bacterium]
METHPQQPSKETNRPNGFTRLLINYPLTCLILTGLIFIFAFLYVTLRYLSKESMTPPDITARIGLSRRLYQEGDYDQTIAINQQLKQRQSQFWQTELTTGNAYFKKGDYAAAAQHFNQAIALNPEMPLPHLNLALTHFRAGKREEACNGYRYVIEHFGEEYPQFKEKAAVALECMGDITPMPSSGKTAEETVR